MFTSDLSNKRKRPEGQWSLYFKECIDCGTRGDPKDYQTNHGSKGRCKRCDSIFNKAKYRRIRQEKCEAQRLEQEQHRGKNGVGGKQEPFDIIIKSNDKIGDKLPCINCKKIFPRDDRIDTEGMHGQFTVFCKPCYKKALRI